MTVLLSTLVNYCDTLLQSHTFKDYCPNGLQIEGKANINTIVTGVSASLELIDKAIALNADAIFVHHGYFWKGEDPCITSYKRERIQRLLTHEISLIGYHLPLDAHQTIGNNVQLAHKLDLQITGSFETDTTPSIGLLGQLTTPLSDQALSHHIQTQLLRQPLYIKTHDRPIQTIAWCTGAAQDYILNAARAGADAYLSGEISERTTLLARELGIDYISAGHHATERYGVKALGEHVASQFSVQCHFVDIDNPA